MSFAPGWWIRVASEVVKIAIGCVLFLVLFIAAGVVPELLA